jgi:hypothetical protein
MSRRFQQAGIAITGNSNGRESRDLKRITSAIESEEMRLEKRQAGRKSRN